MCALEFIQFADAIFFRNVCCSGYLELSEKCLQDLVLKDQNHPAALVNYAALLLIKYGSVIAGITFKCNSKLALLYDNLNLFICCLKKY